jgi:hypothetical protein
VLSFAGSMPIYLYAGVADMRKSFDGLLGLIQQAKLDEPLSGAWFVFRNRRGNRLKILYFDKDGLAIWYKRLEQGRFQWPPESPPPPPEGVKGRTSMRVEAGELRLILEGIDLHSVRRRKRYVHRPNGRNPVENSQKVDNGQPDARVAADPP